MTSELNKNERYSRVPQITVTQLKGPKGDEDMQAANRNCNVHPMVMRAADRFKRYGR